MAVTVKDLKRALEDFDEDMLVYIVWKDGLEFPRPKDAFIAEGMSAKEARDCGVDHFVLIEAAE